MLENSHRNIFYIATTYKSAVSFFKNKNSEQRRKISKTLKRKVYTESRSGILHFLNVTINVTRS